MASDSGYNYNSSQESSNIDYQIDLFEFRQCVKSRKSKQKIKKSSCPISTKILKSHLTLVKDTCNNHKQTPKAEQKLFRYDHYPSKPKFFECDEQFLEEQTSTPSNSRKILEVEHLENFEKFRRHFYHINHESIKSSFKGYPHINITDIRLAEVNESVQNEFMNTLNKNSSFFPKLVYHGTRLDNIESILRYGLLIPNQPHSSNDEAPIIVPKHGRSFGTGIYSATTPAYSLAYVNDINTLLVCAAIPNRDKVGKIKRCHGNILVLSHVTRIIPLFLVDFKYLAKSGINHPWFNEQKEVKMEEKKQVNKSVVISKKYLRKVLICINDEERKNNRYQVRAFDFSL
jgi:hypothetical protein